MLLAPCYAEDPKPDPAGIATGDRTPPRMRGGTSFMVSAPTDKSDPDYAKKQKAFEEFQAQAAKEPLAVKLADSVGHVRVGTNFAWTLNTGYLVLFMQAGFALLTCGLVRKKNAAHLMMLNFAAYVFAFLAYYAVGLRLPVRSGGGQCGADQYRRHADPQPVPDGRRAVGLPRRQGLLPEPARPMTRAATCLALFQVVFMETAGYIIVGAICERITFGAFLLCELFMGAILYPIFGCWVWGGGWMSQLGSTMGLGHGYVDFAGSTVVHAVGGFCAMALAMILGPRSGSTDRTASREHSPRTTWSLSSPERSSCCSAGWASIRARRWARPTCASRSSPSTPIWRRSRVRPRRCCCGISCSASRMSRWPATECWRAWLRSRRPARLCRRRRAIVIGILAGIMVCLGVLFNERVTKIDDPCGAISVHGFCGWFGAVCVGIFADGTYGAGWNGVGAANYLGHAGQGVTGLLYGDGRQFLCQLGGATLCAAWAFGATFVRLQVVNAIQVDAGGARVELEGWTARVRLLGYPEDAMAAVSVGSES